MALKNGPPKPDKNSIGAKAAIVVNTPKVAGNATFLAPKITFSIVCPSARIFVYILSPNYGVINNNPKHHNETK